MIRRIAWLIVPAVLLACQDASAQLGTNGFGMAPAGNQVPYIPPTGDWAEIVTVTPKWLVIQNQKGQQFPVSLEAIGDFVIRWPIDPSQITAGALLEVTGLDMASLGVKTDHVDVFEGNARRMVTPMVQHLMGYNRQPTALDMLNVGVYGYGIPMLPGEEQIPNRLYVAGPIAAVNPLRIAVDGNNMLPVVPWEGGIQFSQVTPGLPSYLRPGDLLYVVPMDFTVKSLILDQMVAYKAMSLSQFVP